MFDHFLAFFKPQDLRDRETQATFRVLNAVLLISLLGAFGTLAAVFTFTATPQARAIVIGMAILLLVSFILLRRRILLPARIMAPLALFITVAALMMTGSGLHDVSLIAFGGIIILASLTLGRRAAIVFGGMTIAAIFGVGLAEMNGSLVTDASHLTTPDDPFIISIVVVAITATQVILINRLNLSAEESRANEQAQAEANRELTEIRDSLEMRIAERTAELENANRLNARRAAQFEAVARITQAVRSAQSRQEALSAVVNEICAQFDHPYAAIHMLDEENQTIQVRAASRSGSAAPLTESRRPLNEDALLEQVVLGGSPRIILDDGRETITFSNPALPDTHSQMLLPLKTGARLVGILDIQSDKPDAFSTQEISAYSVLTDQISIAIENIQLLETTRASLEETVAADRRTIRREWARFLREENLAGYRYVAGESVPLQKPLPLEGAGQAFESGTVRQFEAEAEGEGARLDVAVKLRGQPIGLLRITAPRRMRWSEDDIDIAEVVADRLALALENARLFRASASRAARERIVSDISSRISGNVRVKNILQVAAQELSQALDGSEVLIQLQTPKQPEVEE